MLGVTKKELTQRLARQQATLAEYQRALGLSLLDDMGGVSTHAAQTLRDVLADATGKIADTVAMLAVVDEWTAARAKAKTAKLSSDAAGAAHRKARLDELAKPTGAKLGDPYGLQLARRRFTDEYAEFIRTDVVLVRGREIMNLAKHCGGMNAQLDVLKFFGQFKGSPELQTLDPRR